jgi:dihydroflavonol-4-reductase
VKVVVTGGSGVVGAAVLRHLTAAGRQVSALSRSEDSDSILRRLGASPIRGDITDPSSLPAAFEGAEIVYHIAGLNTMCPREPLELERVNVGGSVAVVRAAEAAGVRRIVYTSSAATLGEERGTIGREETIHRGTYLSHYERSKHLAELAVAEAARTVEIVCVNPSSVQGPGRATGTGALILDLVRGRLPALVDTRLSIVDIDDCARGHLLAELHGRPGERYVLNSFTLSMRDAVGLLEEQLGERIDVRWLPGWLASVGVIPLEVWSRIRRRQPKVCREMVRTLRHGHAYDGSRAVAELGLTYTAPQDLLRRLVEWFRAEAML